MNRLIAFDWVCYNVPGGKHMVKALARDDGGDQYSSESVSVNVGLKR